MGLPPSSWSSSTTRASFPVCTAMPGSGGGNAWPGLPIGLSCERTLAFNIFIIFCFPSISQTVNVPGHGYSARTCLSIYIASLPQSILPCSFCIIEVYVASGSFCACAWIFPSVQRGIVRNRRSPHSSFFVSIQQRCLYRRRTPIPWQQRRMHVQRPFLRNAQ